MDGWMDGWTDEMMLGVQGVESCEDCKIAAPCEGFGTADAARHLNYAVRKPYALSFKPGILVGCPALKFGHPGHRAFLPWNLAVQAQFSSNAVQGCGLSGFRFEFERSGLQVASLTILCLELIDSSGEGPWFCCASRVARRRFRVPGVRVDTFRAGSFRVPCCWLCGKHA